MGDLRRNNKMIDQGANVPEENPLIEDLDLRPDPPKRLTTEQRREWRRLVRSLPADWFITADLGLVETFIITYCDYYNFVKKTEETGGQVYADKKGILHKNPWWDAAEKSKQYFMVVAGKLKLHPRSREGDTLSKSRTSAKIQDVVSKTGRKKGLMFIPGGK